MGVDFLTCQYCGHNFPDCGDMESCGCGEHWCSLECAELDGFKFQEWEDNEGEEWEESSCNFCREEDFDDYELLIHAYRLLNMSRSDLIESYKKFKRGESK